MKTRAEDDAPPCLIPQEASSDRRALALAGATAVNLPFLDGQYRQGDQAPEEIVEALRGVLLAGARIYAPASLGDHHPDHTAVRAAALALRAEGADVTLYADLPHATVFGWPRWVLDGSYSEADPAGEGWATQLQETGVPVERMVAATHRLSPKEHAAKLEAVLTYSSQTAPLQQVFESSLEDPQLLGLEVDWRLGNVCDRTRIAAVSCCLLRLRAVSGGFERFRLEGVQAVF
jgi:LmbE family N-acetylglucosaminyl deacetylase